jgi:type II secretion system protein H
MPAPDKPHRDGYTLIEVVVVLAIFGIMLAVAVPSMTQGNSWRRLDGDGQDLASRAQMARQMAVLKRTPYRLTLDRLARTYTFERQVNSSTWVPDPNRVYSFEGATTVTSRIGGSTTATRIVFETQGTVTSSQAPAEIDLLNSHGDKAAVSLVRTGRITSKMIPAGS